MFNEQELKTDLEKTIEHLKQEFSQIRTGRASAELVEPIKVDAYGTQNALKNLGNISVSDTRSLIVQLWDKSLIDSVVKGIEDAKLGLKASQEGDAVRIFVPELTQERRMEYVKVMKERAETARIAVRNVRQKYMKIVEEAVKSGMSEDEGKRYETTIEAKVKETNEQIEELKEAKEKDLMTV